MNARRLEAFSDGVVAIVITIMVLELNPPERAGDLAELRRELPDFFAYVLSFVHLGVYWNNHHHMLQATERVNGGILWANHHLMFWLSLVPFCTRWLASDRSAVPTAAYGVVLLFAAAAYQILQRTIVREHGGESLLATAIGADLKGKVSLAAYLAAVLLAFVHPLISIVLYVAVAVVWMVPDRRIERNVQQS